MRATSYPQSGFIITCTLLLLITVVMFTGDPDLLGSRSKLKIFPTLPWLPGNFIMLGYMIHNLVKYLSNVLHFCPVVFTSASAAAINNFSQSVSSFSFANSNAVLPSKFIAFTAAPDFISISTNSS